MKVHHIGYFVDDIESAKKDFKKLGWEIASPCTFDELRKIYIQFMKMDNILIELVSAGGGVYNFSKTLEKFRQYSLSYLLRMRKP